MTSPLTGEAAERCRIQIARVGGAHAAFDALRIVHAARRFAPHFFSSYAFGVVESGACRITTPRGTWTASVGSLLAFSPGELHRAEVTSADPYGYRMAYLGGDVARDVLRGVGASGTAPVIQVPVVEPSPLTRAFAQAHHALLADPADVVAEGQMLSCMRELVCTTATASPSRLAAGDVQLVEKARAYLAVHVGRAVYLDDVAACCGVTPFRLIRVFRRVTGLSPYAWLILLRVNHARRLLDAGAPVSDVAYACGFSDQSHLTRTFKRTLGLPPGQYLRSIQPRAA